ncbi:HdeD family acid-resistance protein [Hyalangium versicolor]|uniref:HdeD family acid-resistance protein n=1 Tax=Hyalangium versicolor TaxID=2861190 RepID=UPI001CCC4A7D|nr:DUF308 domain-containing protein [Hyalangium versicolor]
MASISSSPDFADRTRAALWGTPFVVGLLLMVLGLFAFGTATLTSLISIVVFGAMLAASGVLEIVYAFRWRQSSHFLLYLLGGVLSLVVGVLMLLRPLAGLATVTLLLAGYFFASGLFRGITSLMDRYLGWGWDLFAGLVSIFLGVLVMAQWPISALWIVGALVGAEIFFRGVRMVAGSLELRRGLRAATP